MKIQIFSSLKSVFLNEYGEQTSIELKDDKSVSASLRIGSYEIDMDGFLRLNSDAMKNIHGISDDNIKRESIYSTNSHSNNANSSINNNNNGSNNNQINISRRASFDEMPMIAQLRSVDVTFWVEDHQALTAHQKNLAILSYQP